VSKVGFGYKFCMRNLLLMTSCLILAACWGPTARTDNWVDARDTHTFARPDQVRSKHLSLELHLDFEQKMAVGSVTHHIERSDRSAPFIVDTSDLSILAVTDEAGQDLSWELAPSAGEWRGQPLTIQLGEGTEKVRIQYQTSPHAEAMQWLSPEQTNGKKKPFLFTQGQAILTRSWIPLQDSPAVRVTWNARVTAPEGMTTVMSADYRNRKRSHTEFQMTRPVPSYLIALACGEIVSRPISGRCAVWAEPGMIDKATFELNDLERMVLACEELFGPYRWGRYDVLFLPPSFPFGGMENPCMTFATPTILAGDRSLVALIAHELAHSWSGNLVTNATWRDFWLNEGFTVYLEQRIMEHVYGKDRAVMEIALGMQGLQQELTELPEADQVLHIDLTDRNPDDGMTAIAYDKGAAFLRRIEQVFGRVRMDQFLRAWFQEHAFQSLTTQTFLSFLHDRLLSADPRLAAKINVDEWVTGFGLPSDAPIPDSERFAAVDSAVASFLDGADAAKLGTKNWVTQQWLRFLSGVKQPTQEQMVVLDDAFGFTRSGNSEILSAWLAIATRNNYPAANARLELFLMTVGRRKFLVPLYQALLDAENGEARASAIYKRARMRYHAVSQRTLDAMLGYKPGE